MNTIMPGPDTVIADIHELGVHLGFERVRIDRGAIVEGGREICYFEVGYATQEIHVRFSHPLVRPYRANWRNIDGDEILGRMCRLIELSHARPSDAARRAAKRDRHNPFEEH